MFKRYYGPSEGQRRALFKKLVNQSRLEEDTSKRNEQIENILSLGLKDEEATSIMCSAIKEDTEDDWKIQMLSSIDKIAVPCDDLFNLLKTLLNSQYNLQISAMAVCGRMQLQNEELVKEIVKRLKHPSRDLKRQAAETLGQIGVTNEEILTGLLELARDVSVGVKLEAITALANLNPKDDRVLVLLADLLNDTNEMVRLTVGKLLNSIAWAL